MGTIKHPTAIINANAKLAVSVEIGPYVVIGEDVEIGTGTKIGAHTIIEHATIGQNCKISPHAFIGTAPQDIRYNQEETRLVLGDNCVVRECVTLNRGTLTDGGQGITKIGKNCFFMAYSHVAHDCEVGDSVIMANSVALAGHVTVGNDAIFGGLVGAHQFVRVGDGVMIGGLSGIVKDIPPFCMAQGIHAELIGLNSVGLRKMGLEREAISEIKTAYKTLFLSGLTLQEAIVELEKTSTQQTTRKLLEFLKAPSKRGITRPRRDSTRDSTPTE